MCCVHVRLFRLRQVWEDTTQVRTMRLILACTPLIASVRDSAISCMRGQCTTKGHSLLEMKKAVISLHTEDHEDAPRMSRMGG